MELRTDKRTDKKSLIFILVIATIIFINFVQLVQAQEQNITAKIEASQALDNARQDINDMKQAGFSTESVNDTLFEAEQIFIAQSSLEEKGKPADYSLVLTKTNKISETKDKAFNLWDEISALETTINEKAKKNNMSQAYTLLNETKTEFFNEHYDKVPDLIDKTYEKINEIEALASKFRAIYNATVFNFLYFMSKNWPYIVGIAVFFIIFYLLFWNKVVLLYLKNKKNKLESEKKVLEGLIKKTQYEYFQIGKLAENIYHIRIIKFSELIRDINRQIPVINEQIETRKLGKKTEIGKEKIKEIELRIKQRPKEEKKKEKFLKLKIPGQVPVSTISAAPAISAISTLLVPKPLPLAKEKPKVKEEEKQKEKQKIKEAIEKKIKEEKKKKEEEERKKEEKKKAEEKKKEKKGKSLWQSFVGSIKRGKGEKKEKKEKPKKKEKEEGEKESEKERRRIKEEIKRRLKEEEERIMKKRQEKEKRLLKLKIPLPKLKKLKTPRYNKIKIKIRKRGKSKIKIRIKKK